MDDKIDDGGPAFPALHLEYRSLYGMSLRDWFAGQALVGLLAGEAGSFKEQGTVAGLISDGHTMIAGHAYLIADAMLKARSLATRDS